MRLSLLATYFATRAGIILAGALIGLVAAVLQLAGNPPNMGFCTACFERDLAGALGLHRAAAVQYLRPEIPAVVLGALLAARLFGEHRLRGGSSPLVRLALGACAGIGALVFLGCPWRALLRLAGGDLNAVTGLAGLTLGIAVGIAFLKAGFGLGRAYPLKGSAHWLAPLVSLVLLVMLLTRLRLGDSAALFFSASGPGAQHAAPWIGILAGLLIGLLAQRSRFCSMGGIRDLLLTRDTHLLLGVAALVAAVLAVNLLTGRFRASFDGQPIAHAQHLWNFLSMVLSGLAYTLAGGCPGRQLVLSGEGNTDAGVFVTGMVLGLSLAHNFNLAASPAGVPPVGGVAVVAGLLFCLWIGLTHRERLT